MTRETARSTSRRTFIKCGLLSGALAGTTGSAAGVRAETADRVDEPTAEQTESIDWGVMRPYQYAPQAGVTVVESGLDWQPAMLRGRYRTHVLAYDHAPSFRSLLFTAPGGPAVESGQSLELEEWRANANRERNPDQRQQSPSTIGGRFVPVGLHLSADTSSGDE